MTKNIQINRYVFMKKEYEKAIVMLLQIQEDVVRCSEGAQEDVFGDDDWD